MTDKIKEDIKVAKESFKHVFDNIEISEEANNNLFLDFAILIALHTLELFLIERILSGKDTKISEQQAKEISNGKWGLFFESTRNPDTKPGIHLETNVPLDETELNKLVLEYLDKINVLKDLQREHHDPSMLRSQKFANKARRGLLVTSFEFCEQYE